MMVWRGQKKPAATESQPYKIYTDQFDQVVFAEDLLRTALSGLKGFQASRDELHRELHAPTPARVKALHRAIQFQARLRAGHDLGPSPLFTVLLDHSGSMRGVKALSAATATSVCAEIVERENLGLEVLGFTTSSWRGGKSRRKWRIRGSKPNPGRLCDLLHIVYRDARNPSPSWSWSLPLMLAPDVLKENVDGEAIEWAWRRARGISPSTWVCVLISDGVPMDDSTVLANGGAPTGWYLDRHLASVVDSVNADPATRLGCLGLDYSPQAKFKAVSISSVLEEAPVKMFDLLESLIWPTDDGLDPS